MQTICEIFSASFEEKKSTFLAYLCPMSDFESLHVKPEACYYLGDTMIDMQTANRAGMMAIGALWGFRDEDELLAHGAKQIAKTPSEVIKLLAEV